MKKLLFGAIVAMSVFTASAQNKIGYINTNELIASMPEAAKAETELKEYQTSLQQNFQDISADLDTKQAAFVKDSATFSASMKEIKRKEIIDLYQRVQNYQQESQQQYQEKANEKIAPIREKALTAIKTVAKEAGYSYIFNEETLLVAPQGDNIIGLVKTKLGIKDVPKTAPVSAPRTASPKAAGKK